jgi:uncharacterized repeat protein (TIGR01451 family)
MKLMVARVGSFRGWILVAGLGLMVPAVALVGGSKGLAKTGPALGLTPAVAQQSSASQIDASPLMKRIQSIAQPPRLRIIKERLAPLALAPSAPALMPFAPVTITKDASPISGSAVAQGQAIAYTIQATNGASSDTTVGAGGFVRIIDTAPAGTLFTIVTVQQQPQFGSAWSCTILGGGTSIQCSAGDGAGAGVDTFTTQEFVKIRAEVTVQASAVNGAILTNTATYQFDNDGGGLEGTATSNAVVHVVKPSADLAITKTAETLAGGVFGSSVTAGGSIAGTLPSPVTGPGEILYTLTYRNSGLDDATNVHVRDDIPAGTLLDPTFLPIGVVVTPATGPGLTCQILPTLNNYQLDCTPNTANGVLPAGANGTIQFRVRVPENIAEGTVIRNQATINSEGTGVEPATLDPSGGNNTSNETQNIVRTLADLAITKTGPASVIAGNTITYTLTVTNNGASDAQNVLVKDTLPPNVSFVSLGAGSDSRFACQPDNGNAGIVNCTAAMLIAPAINPPPIIPPRIGSNVASIIIIGRVAASVANGTVLTNNASVSSSTQDPVAANNAASPINTTVATDAAVTIIKTDSPDPVTAGTNLTYNITVNNNGPSDARAVSVVDTLPPATQVQFLSAVGTGVFSAANSCTQAANVVTCTAIPGGVFAAGAAANITIVVRVLSSVPANVPPNIPNNASGLLNSATINWTDSNGVIGPLLAQSATDTERTTVRRESLNADLSVTKGALTVAGGVFGGSVTAGGNITPGFGVGNVGLGEIEYTITYRNSGVDDATNVHIRDVIPAGTLLDPTFLPIGVVVTPASGPGLTCQILPTLNTYQLDCTPNTAGGVLPAGANGTIQFSVRVPENILDGAVIKNIATMNSEGDGVTPATPDPNGGNNTSNETQNIVRASADLAITKTGPASVTAGNTITYTLTVTNNGVSDAQNVLVKDTLPPNVSFVSLGAGSDSRFACQPDNGNAGIVNCTAATLIAPAINAPPIIPPRIGNNVATIIIIGKVAASVANGTVLTNNASVSTSTQDPVAANNAASPINTTVATDAAVTIIKTDSPDPVIAGNNLTYNITVNNNGPSDAQAVNVVDTLPPATQVQFLSAAGTGVFSAANSCTQAANVVTCTAIPGGVFAAGASANITIVVRVLPGVPANVPPDIPDNASGLLNSATINWTDSNGVIGPLIAQSATDTERTTVRNDASTLSIDNVTVTEGTGGTTNATFTVTMAAQSSLPVTVDFVTSDNTASAPGDYTSQSGTLTFAPGVTTRNIIVPVIGDSLPEPIETFLVTLFNPTNATIGTAQGTGTINDDDASGVFQFSAATANVNENAIPGSITLTINRTGDTTGVASVGFETSDITALQKTDYTFNAGTVQFGPGVTSKTIDILIVNDAFVEGPETFRVTLLNASGNFVVGPIGSSVITITSDDAVLGPNPIDAAGFFVRQQYLDFLGREPDPAGLAFWTAQITACGVDPACIEERRVNVSGSFFLSIEFQETSGNVIRTQRVAFARQSGDPSTRVSYLPFMRDTRKVGQGVIFGQPGADLLLEQNKQAYAQKIVASPAFIARFPFAPAATYVDALYASAAVTPTAAERTAAINAFGAGGIPGRVAALRSIADSDSLRVAEFRTSFVLAEYFGYLRRNPTDAPDFDNVGYQFWLNKLNLFNGNFQQAEMVKAFIASIEYRGRFGTP